MNQPAKPNMPRDTVETLKQIQKQGLSISLVSTPNVSLSSAITAETRSKQNALIVDKASKMPARSQAVTENKSQLLQSRLAGTLEPRVSSVRITELSSTLHDGKAPGNQNKVVQPVVSEAKAFGPNWSGPGTPTDSKVQQLQQQGTANRSMLGTPVNKMPNSQPRLSGPMIMMDNNKTPVRVNQSLLPDNKTPGRVPQRVAKVQQVMEGKMQINQERLSPASPPLTNQIRTTQPYIVTHDVKPTPGQRMLAPKPVDINKINQIGPNKQMEVKTTAACRIIPSPKIMAEAKIRPNFVVKGDGKAPPMVAEMKMPNSVRIVGENSVLRTPQSKVPPVPIRMAVSPVENLNSKMVQTGTLGPDGKLILSGTKVPISEAIPDAPLNTPLSTRMAGGKRAAATLSPAKKKCIKRLQPNASMAENNFNSEDGNENEDQIFNNLKSNRAGLTITPIRPTAASTPNSTSNSTGAVRMPGELLEKDVFRVICPSCNNYTSNPKFCPVCKCNLTTIQNTQQSTEVVQNMPGASYVVTKKMTNVILSKQIITVKPQDGMSQSIQFGQTVQKKVMIKSSPMIQMSPRTKARTTRRRKPIEPVCLTLSSDDDEEEEHMQASFSTLVEENINQSQVFPHESESSRQSGQSSPVYQEEENESDDQFPGVTDIRHKQAEEKSAQYKEEDDEEENEMMDEMEIEEEESLGEGEEEEEELESEIEDEEEEVPPEEEPEEGGPLDNSCGVEEPLRCRSVRIGSYKVHPKTNNSYLNVYLSHDGLSFNAPMVTDLNKIVNITLKPCDITLMYVHFGRCLPIVFIFTTPSFAETLRKGLNMCNPEYQYFDPTINDEKQKKITFLIDSVNDEQRRFLRSIFLPDNKVQELDQKSANEILVRSTPNQPQMIRCDVTPPLPLQVSSENQLTVTPVMQTVVKVTPVPPQPVTKLFTYPPPPQTGGITITNEDMACLDEGEFLNDAIIDFYLKYIFTEKLSEYHREKTHVFSSYFFPRLTHKPERARPGDEKSMQVRRHSQVRNWTRHYDIFSKDFIIIPVNQNVHWFLAIICYPSLAPEATESISPVKPDLKINGKSNDNVSSTDDQEENKLSSKETSSSLDGNPNSDENSTASSGSAFENEEPDSEEPEPEAPDSSTHPDKNRRRKEAPCICIFDSLNGPNRNRIAAVLREYIDMEWKMKKGTKKVFDKITMPSFILQCPQQTNYSDCGIFLLQYVESFFENPLPYFDNPIPNLMNWFPKEKVINKRQELKDLIVSLQKMHGTNTKLRKSITTENVPASPAQTLQTDNR